LDEKTSRASLNWVSDNFTSDFNTPASDQKSFFGTTNKVFSFFLIMALTGPVIPKDQDGCEVLAGAGWQA